MMFEASVHMDEDLTEMASEYAREKGIAADRGRGEQNT